MTAHELELRKQKAMIEYEILTRQLEMLRLMTSNVGSYLKYRDEIPRLITAMKGEVSDAVNIVLDIDSQVPPI